MTKMKVMTLFTELKNVFVRGCTLTNILVEAPTSRGIDSLGIERIGDF